MKKTLWFQIDPNVHELFTWVGVLVCDFRFDYDMFICSHGNVMKERKSKYFLNKLYLQVNWFFISQFYWLVNDNVLKFIVRIFPYSIQYTVNKFLIYAIGSWLHVRVEGKE